ncbi:MAG: hypothetical protein VST70_07980 [Nitrospirota bacterium]|nr:hypothetical protein [Nitrospirota bacterium]
MVRHDLSLLTRVFDVATKEWKIHLPFGNPVRQIRMLSMPRHRDRRLPPGELERIFSASSCPGFGGPLARSKRGSGVDIFSSGLEKPATGKERASRISGIPCTG